MLTDSVRATRWAQKIYHDSFLLDSDFFFFTFPKVGERLQDAPSESCHGVLHAGAQTEHALEVGLLQQQLPVRHELVRPAQQGGDAVYKLRHEARVRVVRLAVVVGHNLEDGGTEQLLKH